MKTEDEIAEQQAYVAGLERACEEWAEASQRSYQRAKRYFEALEKIAQTQYGLQSIMEDCDSAEYLQAALSYYSRLATLYQRIAREAIKEESK
jgi:hypothetical protein